MHLLESTKWICWIGYLPNLLMLDPRWIQKEMSMAPTACERS